MAVTASVLLPVAAWATAASLAATSEDLRAVLTAADGRPRVLLVDALGLLLFVVAAAVLGILAAVVFDPHPAALSGLLLGGLLHLLCGAVGVALALLLHAACLARGTQALVVIAASLASGRLRWLPPDGPVLSGWGADRHPSGRARRVGGRRSRRRDRSAARGSLRPASPSRLNGRFVTGRTTYGVGADGTGERRTARSAGSTTVTPVPARQRRRA